MNISKTIINCRHQLPVSREGKPAEIMGVLSLVSGFIKRMADKLEKKDNEIYKKAFLISNREERKKVIDAMLSGTGCLKSGWKDCNKETHVQIAEQLDVLQKDLVVDDYSMEALPAFEAYVKKIPSADVYGRHGILPVLEAMKSMQR